MNNTSTLWEDADLTEQWKKSENKPIFVLSDGIKGTSGVSAMNVCEDTGNKKKWTRNCPKCNRELAYKHSSNWCTAKKLGSLCKSCWSIYHIKKEKKWTKLCTKCGRLQGYTSKKELSYAIRINRICYSCSASGKPRPEEYRKKISNTLTGRKLSEEHKQKIRTACQNVSDEARHKMSIARKGRPSPMRGTKLTKEWRMNIRRGLLNMSPELKQKVIDGNKNRETSNETRRKMRLAAIKNIEIKKFGGAQMKPAFNFRACQYFDDLGKQNGWNLQHAMNGGEYYLKDLGYWVDAYDKDRNIVIEYDEGQHNKKKDADVRRMNEIKQKLGCKFFRYDAVSEELKEY